MKVKKRSENKNERRGIFLREKTMNRNLWPGSWDGKISHGGHVFLMTTQDPFSYLARTALFFFSILDFYKTVKKGDTKKY